jgi:hypothetical protein
LGKTALDEDTNKESKTKNTNGRTFYEFWLKPSIKRHFEVTEQVWMKDCHDIVNF